MNMLTICKTIHSNSMEPGPTCKYFYVMDQMVFAVVECQSISQTTFIEINWFYNDDIVQNQASFYTPQKNNTNRKIVSYIHVPVVAHRRWYGKWRVEVSIDYIHIESHIFYVQPPANCFTESRAILDLKI